MHQSTKHERVETRLTTEQKDLLQRAAAIQGSSLSEFMLSRALSAAESIIKEHAIISLSAAESRAFAEALLTPPPPTAALRAAAERHRADAEANQ